MTERRTPAPPPTSPTPDATADDRRQAPRPVMPESESDGPPAAVPAAEDQAIDTAGTPADPEHATREEA